MLAVIEPDGAAGNWSPKAEASLAAALLHDVGHDMFSHAFETAMDFFLSRNQLKAIPLSRFRRRSIMRKSDRKSSWTRR
jgi:HD superfamily phosphohydrolase